MEWIILYKKLDTKDDKECLEYALNLLMADERQFYTLKSDYIADLLEIQRYMIERCSLKSIELKDLNFYRFLSLVFSENYNFVNMDPKEIYEDGLSSISHITRRFYGKAKDIEEKIIYSEDILLPMVIVDISFRVNVNYQTHLSKIRNVIKSIRIQYKKI